MARARTLKANPFAKIAAGACEKCGKIISEHSADEIVKCCFG